MAKLFNLISKNKKSTTAAAIAIAALLYFGVDSETIEALAVIVGQLI